MRLRTGHGSAVTAFLAATLPCFGCTPVRQILQGPIVSHNRDTSVRYPGHSIDLVDATPAPGTALTKGSVVRFTMNVKYVLQVREKGQIALFFRDERGQYVRSAKEASIDIERGKSRTTTLSQEVVVPEVMDLFLVAQVFPEGISSHVWLSIRYPVSR